MATKQRLFNEPKVILYHNVLTHEQCDFIIDRTREKLQPSLGYDFDTKGSRLTEHRTSSTYCDSLQEFAFATAANYQAIREEFYFLKFDKTNFESPQIQHYDIGQQYKHHWDFFNFPHIHSYDNDRIATCIIYLNDVDEGGETDFPLIGIKVKPKKGSMIFFDYKYIYELNEKTKHAGLPPVSGEKWILTSWVHRLPFSS